jgi:hypothetical protein
MRFYEHSGRGGTWGVPLAAICGMVAAGVLALAYVYVLNWIPFIYVSFLATAGFGFGVGAAVACGAKIGKLRNMTLAMALGGLVGLIAVYFAWAFDPKARFPQEVVGPFWSLDAIFAYMKFGYEEGFWSIGRGGGAAVTGPFLAAVWIAEAGLIIGISAWAVKLMLGEQPFCEETNQWTKTEKGVARLSLENDEQIQDKLQQLLAGNIPALNEFFRTGANSNHLQLDVATCADCPTCKFLTVRMIQYAVNKKGEVEKQESKLLVNMYVTPTELELIRTAGVDRPAELEQEAEVEEAADAEPA